MTSIDMLRRGQSQLQVDLATKRAHRRELDKHKDRLTTCERSLTLEMLKRPVKRQTTETEKRQQEDKAAEALQQITDLQAQIQAKRDDLKVINTENERLQDELDASADQGEELGQEVKDLKKELEFYQNSRKGKATTSNGPRDEAQTK